MNGSGAQESIPIEVQKRTENSLNIASKPLGNSPQVLDSGVNHVGGRWVGLFHSALLVGHRLPSLRGGALVAVSARVLVCLCRLYSCMNAATLGNLLINNILEMVQGFPHKKFIRGETC